MEMACSTSGRIEAQKSSPQCMHAAFTNGGRAIIRRSAPFFAQITTPIKTALRVTSQPVTSASSTAIAEDKWIAHTLDAATPLLFAPQLTSLQSSCNSALSTMRMPTTKNEEYRFTDVAPILSKSMVLPPTATADEIGAAVALHPLKTPTAASLVVVNGVLDKANSKIHDIPADVYIGGLEGAPPDIINFALGSQSRGRGGPFATLNGALAQDVVVVHVPSNVTITKPIHVLYLSTGCATSSTTRALSAPRLLIVLEEKATAHVIEEFSGLPGTDTSYMTTSVAEIELDDGSSFQHGLVELESEAAVHFKSTLVNQGAESSYSLTEARLGGILTRHDLGIDQLGAQTESTMKSFLLAGVDQLHDLHSKLKLDHPNGVADQLHKCIAAHPSARGVFDGNVRVNRAAQKTDAQQLSRNLLLAPRATVNVKPNLQIIADDVKCTHGCSVSDLEDEELFYLRSRGIDAATARRVLVYSFGREVVQHLKDDALLQRVEEAAKSCLVRAGSDQV